MSRAASIADDLVTVEEFYRIVRDGQKADLIDGVIYMASPDSDRSNDITAFVQGLIRHYAAAKRLGGRTFVNRYSFELSPIRAPEPDVAYVTAARNRLVQRRGMKGGPDIAVEVVSRDSRTRDYVEKKQLYEDARVTEYWIIDPVQLRVEFHVLKRGRYQLAPLENNRIFRSTVLRGFWIDVDWLLSDPLPNDYECLQTILKSS